MPMCWMKVGPFYKQKKIQSRGSLTDYKKLAEVLVVRVTMTRLRPQNGLVRCRCFRGRSQNVAV